MSRETTHWQNVSTAVKVACWLSTGRKTRIAASGGSTTVVLACDGICASKEGMLV
jgi:hypothetical protein